MIRRLTFKSQIFTLAAAMLVSILLLAVFSIRDWSSQVDAATDPPNIMGYQGRVLNANGVPLSDASVNMIFEIYDASTGGSCLWSNSSATCATATARSVSLIDGLFSERLGDTSDSYAAISDATFGDNASLYLQVTIAGETLSPRTRLLSVPYATNADMIDGIDSTSLLTSSGCTDCLDFDDFSDTMSIDADTSISLASEHLDFNLTSSGDVSFQDSGADFATFSGNPLGGQILFTANNDLSSGFFTVTGGSNTETGNLVDFFSTTSSSGNILNISQDPNSLTSVASSGNLISAYRELTNATSTSTGPLVYIHSNNDSGIATDSSILLSLDQDSTNATGDILSINSVGSGNAIDIDMDAAAFAIEIFNDGNLDTRQGINIQGCLDTNPTASCHYLQFTDGNGTILGAVEGDGAGGVTNASAGSDYAELFTIGSDALEAGDVIGLSSSGQAVLARNASEIMGAYSTNPNVLGNWFDGWQDAGTHAPVALLGQVPVKINTEGGTVNPGDYLTLSSVAGMARRATGVGYVIGRALEADTDGDGKVMAFIEPKWIALNLLAEDGTATKLNSSLTLSTDDATGTNILVDSPLLRMSGSVWDGSSAVSQSIVLFNDVTATDSYRLVAQNTAGDDLAYVSQNGDLSIKGRLYLGDRGSMQDAAYLYYDGSDGPGGDFIRTNASGFSTGSYDFAEMFPSPQQLEPGEVVVFGEAKENVIRSTGIEYSDTIAGIVSTQPGFLAGENIAGHVPIALAGRVPTKVTIANGAIEIGDPLTTSTIPGVAMKATEPGPVVGYALESASTDGLISVFVRVSYYDGNLTSIADNAVSGATNLTTLSPESVTSFSGSSLSNIASIAGIGNRWRIEENGDIVTRGQIRQITTGHSGSDTQLTPSLSEQASIQLSGTVRMVDGRATVRFAEFDSKFADIISLDHPYRVFMTPSAATNTLYVSSREQTGFIIRESDGSTNTEIDWMVIGFHKDYAPQPTELEDGVIEDTNEADSTDNATTNDSTTSAPVSEEHSDQVEEDISDNQSEDANAVEPNDDSSPQVEEETASEVTDDSESLVSSESEEELNSDTTTDQTTSENEVDGQVTATESESGIQTESTTEDTAAIEDTAVVE